MKPLFTPEELENAKPNDKLPCECYFCNKIFYRVPKEIRKAINNHKTVKVKFCSIKCRQLSSVVIQRVICKNCNLEFNKLPSQIKKSKNNFCSRSCAITYNNKNKTYGTRRSKLEIYLEKQLTILYPNLHIDYNKKEAINSELDIYIPSLKLAFELNGIFHYESIHGQEKLSKIQNNDENKFQACIKNNISLCIIDISKQKYFKESTSREFLSIIIDIINNKSKN